MIARVPMRDEGMETARSRSGDTGPAWVPARGFARGSWAVKVRAVIIENVV